MANCFPLTLNLLVILLLAIPSLSFIAIDTTHKGPLRIAAFNIRHFGRKLMRNSEVVLAIDKIFERYDVVLVEEVRDGSNTALFDLQQSLQSPFKIWHYIASEPLGSTRYYKEQYAFFYRIDAVKHIRSHQVNDSADSFYEREPFAVEFEYKSAAKNVNQRVVLMAFHSKPTKTKQELQHFPATIRSVASVFPDAIGVIALGDFNADCRYLRGKWRNTLELFNSPEFKSLIPHSADTTVATSSHCAYDRIFVYGSKIDARNATVFNFEKFHHLTKAEAKAVSDHYPVEFVLH